jgi:uncharacterized phage protein gp47/JayE
MTYEEILESCLSRIDDTFDKREGSVIYDAIAPCCYELAKAYEELDKKLMNTYARTADREHLILRAEEIGIAPYPATYAIRKGIFTPSNLDVLDKVFSFDNVNYKVTQKIKDGEYELTCETLGEVGNVGSGQLIPIDYINGLETATLTQDVIVYGEEEEDTERFRTRYFDTLRHESIDGNITQYKKWCNEFSGIGNVKIFPLWNGKNTVKVSILNSQNGVASQELIDDFQAYLDPNSQGLGNGQAPIGAIVTVDTASERKINIDVNVTLKSGFRSAVGVKESIENYFKSLAYDKNFISYISLGSVILMSESVEGVGSLFINGLQADLFMLDDEIPVLNKLNINIGVRN